MEKKLQNKSIIEISISEDVRMADEWYDIAPADHFWVQWRFKALIQNKILDKLSNKRLLEIGCGHGLVIKQFESLNNITVDGCDLNQNALKFIENIKGNTYLLNIYDKPEQLLKKYSGILLMDVLEHIEFDSDFLQTSCKYLKNEGLVIVNVPAFKMLFSKYDKKIGHLRRYNKKMLNELFEKNNIQIIDLKYWGFSLFPVVLLRKLYLFFVNEEKIVSRGFKSPGKLTNFMFKLLMKVDLFLFKNPPIGSSLIAIGRYKPKE